MTLRGNQTEKKEQCRPKSARGIAAMEIAESARDIKLIADKHGFKMVAYLLDLVALEAVDCWKSIHQAEKAAAREADDAKEK